MSDKLFLGVGRRKITPTVGTCLYGYKPGLESTSVNDDLTSTAFFFKQGDRCALMLSVTVGSVRDDIIDGILDTVYKKHGIPRSAAIISAIHTHSAPNITGTFGWGDIDVKYCNEIFIPETLEAIDEAVTNVAPVKMAVASGESRIGINRRELKPNNTIALGQNPWGTFDPQMTVISFVSENGIPVANMIHYGAHATAAGPNTEISRDWPGFMTDALESETGAVTAFFNGPEGDVGPRLSNGKTTGEGDIKYAYELGEWAGRDAISIFKNMGEYHTPLLSSHNGKVEVPLMPRIPLEEAKIGYEEYKEHTVNRNAQRAKYYHEVISSYENGYEEVSHRSFEQNIIRLGDVAFVAFSFELFSEIGLRIKKESNIPYVLSLSNSNGSSGYFATEPELCRGGYEIIMTSTSNIQGYARDADWHIVRNTVENLSKTEE